MNAELKVPVGRCEKGQLVRPEQAVKGERYRCPSCFGEVLLRGGTSRVRLHFAHRADPDYCDFENESEEHWRAKAAIAEIVTGGVTFFMRRACNRCHFERLHAFQTAGLLPVLEYQLSTGHRADVALLDVEGTIRLIVEIKALHAVSRDKAAAISQWPWIELHADDVLRSVSSTPVFLPIGPARSAFECPECQERRLVARLIPFSGPTKQHVACPLLQNSFIIAVDACSSCPHFAGARAEGITCLGLRDV